VTQAFLPLLHAYEAFPGLHVSGWRVAARLKESREAMPLQRVVKDSGGDGYRRSSKMGDSKRKKSKG
jgi:hypothetical protein